jgi:hypothetical protein
MQPPRKSQLKAIRIDDGEIAHQKNPNIQRAGERIGLHIDEWHQMAWYVKFSQQNITTMSEGELKTCQEEVEAICRYRHNYGKSLLLARHNLTAIQQKIGGSLSSLLRTGGVHLGTFCYSTLVFLSPEIGKARGYSADGQHWGSPLENPPEIQTKKILKPNNDELGDVTEELMSHLAELLGKFGNKIVRCNKCQKFFLQFRRHSKFCSRQCQSRAAMETVRKNKKAAQLESKSSTKKHKGSSSKRRS